MYITRAMRKYGVDNFEIREIDSTDSFQKMLFLESFYIKYYNSIDPKYGYNLIINTHGDGLEFISEEVRLKISEKVYSRNGKPCGVFWDKSRNKWSILSTRIGVRIRKRFDTEIEAKEARDKLSLFLFKEKAVLYFPEKIEIYKNCDLAAFHSNISKKRVIKNHFRYITEDSSGLFIARIRTKNHKRLYIGDYQTDTEAAIAYDKVSYYLYGENDNIHFKELVNEQYKTEGKALFDMHTNPRKQMLVKGGKTSRFNGVNKRSPKTWEMMITSGGLRIREIFQEELDAGKAYDFYVRKMGLDNSKLNFPDEQIIEKPVNLIPRPDMRKKILAKSEPMSPSK